MLQLTVDLTMDKSLLVKAAQFILQFAGYTPPNEAVPTQGLQGSIAGPQVMSQADALIARGKEITRGDMEARDAAKALELPGERDPAAVFASHPLVPEVPVTVPVAPTPPAPPAPAGIDVDKSGLPWDARIHSSTRAKNADGTWRQKRGVDPQLLTTVEAELRHTMAVVPPPPFAGNAAPPAPPAASGTPPVPASAGAATTASPGDVPPAPPVSGKDPEFKDLMPHITKRFTEGTLTKPVLDAALAKVGLPALPMLALRNDLVGAVATELGIAL